MRNKKKIKAGKGKTQRQKAPRPSDVVSAPVSQSSPIKSVRPTIQSYTNRVVISNSEVFDVPLFLGTGAFQSKGYPVNPALRSCFPWLAGVASHYESYRFLNLSFRLRTRMNTTSVGSIGLFFDHDVLDPAPHSIIEASSYHERSIDAPWKDQTLVIDLNNDTFPRRYTRNANSSLSVTPDLKTYDVGQFFICCDGFESTSYSVGSLEVEYRVELITPQLEHQIAGMITNNAGLTPTALFGSVANTDLKTNSQIPFKQTSAGVLEFLQDFEGLINGAVTAPTPTAFVTGGTATSSLVQSLVTAASGIGVFAVSALMGQTFAPFITGVSNPTACSWRWTGADYEQMV